MYPGLVKSTGIVFDSGLRVGPEPPATVLYDKSRYRSNGDFRSDGHPDWVKSPNGLWAMDFDPDTPDYVEIPASYTQLDFTSEDFSVVLRVRLDTLTSTQYLFVRGLLNADGWYCQIHINGFLRVYTNQLAAQQASFTADGSILAATGYTLGFSRNGASIRAYINGVDSTSVAGVHINPVTCGRSAKIGIYDNLATLPFDGKITFLRICNYALSAGQHNKMHNALKDWG